MSVACFTQTRHRLLPVLVALPVVAAFATTASAQLPQTRLYAIFPPGAGSGTSVDLQLTSGADLDEIDRVYFDHPGLRARQKQDGNGNPIPGRFIVSVDKGVAPGNHEVRASGLFGVSNPRSFVVGRQAESREAEPNNSVEQATPLELGVVSNGRINGGADIDFFRFDARQGQRIVITSHAARIDSRLVATMELLDATGRRLAGSRSQVAGDPLIDFTIPADGRFFVRIADYAYRGGVEYIYRLEAHTRPYIDYIMPPAGVAGTTSRFTLFGRNLPDGQDARVLVDGLPLQSLDIDIALPDDPTDTRLVEHLQPFQADIDGVDYSFQGSNPVLIQYASGEISVEQEPNDEQSQANIISVPSEFAGRFQARGDVDNVVFDATAGAVYYVEVFGQRNGTTADPYFVLDQLTKNDRGEESARRITAQDDNGTNPGGLTFLAMTSDPVFRFQVPQDGTYRVSVRDRYFETRGDPRLVYRLAIRREQPDFRLVALPATPEANNQPGGTSSLTLRKGENRSLTVMAFRRDGFNGRIDLRAEGLPDGILSRGASIGPGQTSSELIFTSLEDAPESFRRIRIVGSATLDDPEKSWAVDAAAGPLKSAHDELAATAGPAAKAADDVRQATENRDAANTASELKPDDEGLKKQLTEAENALTPLIEASTKANAAVDAAREELAAAEAAFLQAQQKQKESARRVTRVARSATVTWSGNQDQPGIARTARAIGISVMKDVAHFQATTDVFEIEVNRNRQVLIPVRLTRRQGFDEDVAFRFVGLPKNVDVQNKPINKGSDSEVFRLFVRNNAPEGTYTLHLKGQGKIQYRRNPFRVDREKQSQAEITEVLAKADDALRKATQHREAASNAATDAANALNAANAAKTRAQDKLAKANRQLRQAMQDKQTRRKTATRTDATAKPAATAAKTASDEELADTQAAQKTAQLEFDESEEKRAAAEAALKTANEEQFKQKIAFESAAAEHRSAADAKQAADTRVTNAENAAKPTTIDIASPSTPIVLTIRKAPVRLTANVPNDGNIRRGDRLEVKVNVKRINDFSGPVTLNLPLPPGVTGLHAGPVTIPAGQTQGTLAIRASAQGTEGNLANMVVRATMNFRGRAAVDAPIRVKVNR